MAKTKKTEEAPVKAKAKSISDALAAAGVAASRKSVTLLDPAALTLIRDPQHPLYDPRVDDPVDPESAFYKDLLAVGVRNPILVRRNGTRKDGTPILEVAGGRQRTKTMVHINEHHPLADGVRKVPVEFVQGDDAAMVLLALAENHLRRDETPYSRAVKIQKAVALGKSPAEIAQACGWKNAAEVERHLLILNFIPEVQAKFNGELPAGSIKDFANVPREEQAVVLAKVQDSGASTRVEVATAIKAARAGTDYVAPVKATTKPPAMWPRNKLELLKVNAQAKAEVLRTTPGAANSHEQMAACAALVDYLLGNAKALENYPHLATVVAETAAVR